MKQRMKSWLMMLVFIGVLSVGFVGGLLTRSSHPAPAPSKPPAATSTSGLTAVDLYIEHLVNPGGSGTYAPGTSPWKGLTGGK